MLNTFTAPEIIWRVPEAIESAATAVTETAASAWTHFRESVAAVIARAPQHHEALREITRELRLRVLGPDPAVDDA